MNTQRGNAFFYVMLGVVLFAALGYAVAQSSRGSMGALSGERARVYASEIIEYSSILGQGVNQMRLRGYRDTQISFHNDDVPYVNPACPDSGCLVFHMDGAGIHWRRPDSDFLATVTPVPALRGAWFFTGRSCVPGLGLADAGCESDGVDNEALIAILPYIRKDLCTEINDRLGISNPFGDPPRITGNAWPTTADKFTGTYADGGVIATAAQDFFAKSSGCFEGSGVAPAVPVSGTYHFYTVLIAR